MPSNAPMSAAPSRAAPRWSVAGAARLSPLFSAALPASSAWVRVKPPLSASTPMLAAVDEMSVGCDKLALPSVLRLWPSDVTAPPTLPPPLFASSVFFKVTSVPPPWMDSPPSFDAVLFATVVLSSDVSPSRNSAPPSLLARVAAGGHIGQR